MKRTFICPCRQREDSALNYDECCGVWHAGLLKNLFPDTPEQLMRSRYTAYALAQRNDVQGQSMLNYLLATWHGATTPGEMEISPTPWVGLDLIDAQIADDAGIVEFVAWFKENGKATRMHERSRFIRQGDRWLYLDGKEDGNE
jgi:SEC-C motif domain protein